MRNTVHNLEVFFTASGTGHSMGEGKLLPLVSGRAITEVFFFGGRRGSGKTYAAGVLVEQLLHCGLPVVVVDVVGTWWGLRVGANGDPNMGFKIPVIGGDHGDIGIVAEGGAAVAQMLVDTGSSAVLDLSSLRKGARQRFLTDWAEEFFHGKKSDRSPVHVVLEEAHTIIPQRVMKGQERMLGALEDLVRLGRNYGIGVSMLDQRPQSVHKDVLNQAEVLCAFQLTGAQERDAIRRWAEAKELAGVKDAFTDLSSLPRGECILWSPEWLKFCGRVEVASKSTFDASATPDASTNYASKKMRPIDLGALEAAMQKAASVGKKSEGSMAVKLRKQRDQQNAELDAKVEHWDSPVLQKAEIEALWHERDELRATITTLQHELEVARDDLRFVRDKWARALSAVGVIRGAVDDLGPILQIGELQTLGSTEVIDAPGHPANGARAVHKNWAGWPPSEVAKEVAPWPPAPIPREATMKAFNDGRPTVIPVKQDDPPRHSELAKFLTGTPDPELTPMTRAFLTVLYRRGPLNQIQILHRANYAKSGDTNKAFALLKAKEWVVAGNFGDGAATQLAINGQGARALGTIEPIELPTLSKMERAFLIALAQRGVMNQRQILTQTLYAKSGDTNRTFARLRDKGWAKDADGGLEITEWGREVLGDFDKIPTGNLFAQELIAGRVGNLSQMERNFLAVLWGKGADGETQVQVLKDAQYAKSGDTNKAFAKLRRLGYCKPSKKGIACSQELYDP
jgi:hypothetical protein